MCFNKSYRVLKVVECSQNFGKKPITAYRDFLSDVLTLVLFNKTYQNAPWVRVKQVVLPKQNIL